eukprot:12327559-Karenia_brevis.AAC.2
MHTFTGALAGSRREVCAAGRGAADTKISLARGSFAGCALGLGTGSGASLLATRAGADRRRNLDVISDMKAAVVSESSLC